MRRDIYWTPSTGIGYEHLQLVEHAVGSTAESVVIGHRDDQPFRVHYRIDCARHYRVQRVALSLLGSDARTLVLRSDGNGQWTTGDGEPLDELHGCLDVDLSITPFTQTLPIRRLGLTNNDTTEVAVVTITVPALEVGAVTHRYTCHEPHPEGGGRYRYEPGDGPVELPVDADGIVIDYPDRFERVAP